MARRYRQVKRWVCDMTCSVCGRPGNHAMMAKSLKEAQGSWPSQELNGWDVSKPGREVCPICLSGRNHGYQRVCIKS